MRKEKVLKYQEWTLKALSGKADDFYLAGGTALSLFYFQHRLSLDLDFFTPDFSYKRVNEIVLHLKTDLNKEIKLVSQHLKNDMAKMLVYNIHFTKNDVLKIDFIEDFFKLIKKTKTVEGIKILSIEDIYIRKIYAMTGVIPIRDIIGRRMFKGGRIDAKDFYDLYFLSHTFMPLSRFVDKYGDYAIKEGLIIWFYSYDRMKMVDGLLDLETNKKMDYKNIERHFKKEVDNIIKNQIEHI